MEKRLLKESKELGWRREAKDTSQWTIVTIMRRGGKVAERQVKPSPLCSLFRRVEIRTLILIMVI